MPEYILPLSVSLGVGLGVGQLSLSRMLLEAREVRRWKSAKTKFVDVGPEAARSGLTLFRE
ncbi:hypothetical protein Tdes44962_MAKER08288 [Teratosphaeria destructans]|uniref:Uncharacterized protein n=1 Tax=Teratosphaeria destructans TaxID=418781 RepID=A0A9W7SX82_9PEZI|nr:hypothetical protein Tdes44962_MAKER08288 [Teratosphaeria destructans]